MTSKEVKRICSNLSTNILKWKLASKEGKIILDSIREKQYKDKDDEMSTGTQYQFDEELQKNCHTLSEILLKMQDILAEIETVEDKCLGVSQMCDMSSSSFQKVNNSSLLSSSSSQQNSTQNSSLIELDTSIVYPNDLTKWTQTIIHCYKNQLKMNEIVVRNICHLERREEALFHISIWVCQPSLNTECDLATVAVEQTLKSCS